MVENICLCTTIIVYKYRYIYRNKTAYIPLGIGKLNSDGCTHMFMHDTAAIVADDPLRSSF